MTSGLPILSFEATLRELPDVWPEDMAQVVRERLAEDGHTLIVLDDDPTGTQTVFDVPVLTDGSVEALAEVLAEGAPLVAILTNSRALPEHEAVALTRRIGANLIEAGRQTGRRFRVVSRSDSTLRGHYPAEVDALAAAIGHAGRTHLIVPFFEEGGRYTLNDTHYVRTGDVLTPAGQTPFAKDAAFGYRESNLRRWVCEKTGGRIAAEHVASIGLDDIRCGGPRRVADKLRRALEAPACIVNAMEYRDLDVVAAALLEVEGPEAGFVYRTAASFVRARAGWPGRALLSCGELDGDPNRPLLVIVGSHVPRSSEQLQHLLGHVDITRVELSVPAVLSETDGPIEIERVRRQVHGCVEAGDDVVLYTSRRPIARTVDLDALTISQRVSQALVQVVGTLPARPGCLLAKGGITASDIATEALGIRRAQVLGQILPGVPVWRTGAESRFPDLPYIVFPGNVGDAAAITRIVTALQDYRVRGGGRGGIESRPIREVAVDPGSRPASAKGSAAVPKPKRTPDVLPKSPGADALDTVAGGDQPKGA